MIINADDFGLNRRCTDAICEAFVKGYITDTTFIANGDAYEYSIECISKYNLEDKIGIHFNLTEGIPLTEDIKACDMFCIDGKFKGRINRLKILNKKEKEALYLELSAQIEKLENSGVKLNHCDSHHHIHTGFFIMPVVLKVCKKHNINKIRAHRNIGKISLYKRIGKYIYNLILKLKGFKTTKYFCFDSDLDNKDIPSDIEIMVHPDYDIDHKLIDIRVWSEDNVEGIEFDKLNCLKAKDKISYIDL